MQAEATSVMHIFQQGLLGEAYPDGRGIVSIEVEPEKAITLPLSWVEDLVRLIAKAELRLDYQERQMVAGVKHEVKQVNGL